MINKELFWKTFKECVEHSGTPLLSFEHIRPELVRVDTGYNTIFSALSIILHDNTDSFSIQINCGESMPFEARVWRFLKRDKEKIEARLHSKPTWKVDFYEHRFSNTLVSLFKLNEHTAAGYYDIIKSALPDLITYRKIFRQYIKNLTEILTKADRRVTYNYLLREIKLRDNPHGRHYLINETNFNKQLFAPTKFLPDSAKKIYEYYRKIFEWCAADSFDFEKPETVYIPYATKEGYGIWFVKESNLTDQDIEAIKIYGNGKLIEDTSSAIAEDIKKHLVFARVKCTDNKCTFKFLGVYERVQREICEIDDRNVLTDTYAMISKTYDG